MLSAVLMITNVVFGGIELPLGVIFHEGSTILVILNSFKIINEIIIKADTLRFFLCYTDNKGLFRKFNTLCKVFYQGGVFMNNYVFIAISLGIAAFFCTHCNILCIYFKTKT